MQEMGFKDRDLNVLALLKHQGDLESAMGEIVENLNLPDQPLLGGKEMIAAEQECESCCPRLTFHDISATYLLPFL